jgi:serine protease AprX
MKQKIRPIQVFILIALCLVTAGFKPYQTQPHPARIHPMLLQVAKAEPAQQVAVIVQKFSPASLVDREVQALGGKITKSLPMINAIVVELPAKNAVALSLSSGVRWVSPDAPVEQDLGPDGTVNTSRLVNAYIRAINADDMWSQGYQGSTVAVAVIDSGMALHRDIKTRIVANVKFNSITSNPTDQYGHGTHIAGIIGGNGAQSNGAYIGVAPKVKLINVKISDDVGQALTSDVVAGMQWVLDNKNNFGIRVVNISLNSTVAESYHTSPLDAAAEILWFNGIVVVVSGGNNGTADIYPPANDPFVISVGASDDKGTNTIADDTLASFSAFGNTIDGFQKPDLVAPGKNLVATLAGSSCTLASSHPENKISSYYFKMSGTSMAAAVVSGAVALLLQDEPNLNPDQVKYRLTHTASSLGTGSGAGLLDVIAATNGNSSQTSNTGIPASALLWTGSDPVTWNSVNWGSVNWGSVNWGSVNWGSVNWGSVNWGSDYWGP